MADLGDVVRKGPREKMSYDLTPQSLGLVGSVKSWSQGKISGRGHSMGRGPGRGEEAWFSEDQSDWGVVDDGERNRDCERQFCYQECEDGSESKTSQEEDEI